MRGPMYRMLIRHWQLPLILWYREQSALQLQAKRLWDRLIANQEGTVFFAPFFCFFVKLWNVHLLPVHANTTCSTASHHTYLIVLCRTPTAQSRLCFRSWCAANEKRFQTFVAGRVMFSPLNFRKWLNPLMFAWEWVMTKNCKISIWRAHKHASAGRSLQLPFAEGDTIVRLLGQITAFG